MREFRIKTISDERKYQNTAVLIYIKACKDVLGDVDVRIGNSLNQGFFTYIVEKHNPDMRNNAISTSNYALKISKKMKEIILSDKEIEVLQMSAGEALEIWEKLGDKIRIKLFNQLDANHSVKLVNLDGYIDFFYGDVFPSTGYIKDFEIRKYRQGMLLRLPDILSPDKIPQYRDDDKLYDAYADSKKARKCTGVDFLPDLNEEIISGNEKNIIEESESQYSEELNSIAKAVLEENKQVVLISGPSSSGKTTTAKRLCKEIALLKHEPLYLGTDDYFLNRDKTPIGYDGKPDYEGLSALDVELFNSHIKSLLNGETVDIPRFDFIEGVKVYGERLTKLEEGQILVIEGIHSLNDKLTMHIDESKKYKVYISPLTQIGMDKHNRLSTTDARMLRRIVRDNRTRGSDARKTISNWYKVRAGENANIFPYSSKADVVINSSTVYETNLLRHYAEPLLKNITEDMAEYDEAQRILNLMSYFTVIDSDEFVPQDSILREFIG